MGVYIAIAALILTVLSNIVALVVWGTRLTVGLASLEKSFTSAVNDLAESLEKNETRHDALRDSVHEHDVALNRHEEKLKSHSRRLDSLETR